MKAQKIRAVIVDDEFHIRSLLKNYLADYCPEAEVVGTAEDLDLAIKVIESTKPDLVFLDIQLPLGRSFKLFERFPEPEFEVIFITGYKEYAIQAIKIRPVDYLLKPVDSDELIEAVEKALTVINKKRTKASVLPVEQIGIPTNEGKEFVKIKDILYLEADGSCTKIQVKNRQLYSSKNLKEFEKILSQPGNILRNQFFRIHHGYLINFSFAERYNRHEHEVEMSNQKQLPVAQRRRSEFLSFWKK